ncbi:MAG: electron transfer flavoprotein subunit alpha/FixB family protein [Dehalococcoidia bacterium]|nr:electron transfer flavoprotein subunit alpha/FixB family protein [Dehalococcoidia bacterium]
MPNGVLVFGEAAEGGTLAPVTGELMGAAKSLGGPVACALLGAGVEALAGECAALGADKVIVVDDPVLKDYLADAYVTVAERICKETDSAVVLFGQTMMGRDLAPRLAARLGTAVAMDCVELALSGDRLQATRPCYGGSARARYSINGTPQMATLRAKVYDPPARDPSRQAEVVKQPAGVSEDSIRVRITGRRKEAVEGVRLEDATVVVSGGRGVGGPEGFQSLEELAKLMGGAVGASRAVCDLGWYPVATQIGLTGKVVTPDLYIAVGISGASQHMAGISQVKNIVAINKDPEATIFKSSRFGVVGDWKEVVSAFTEKVRELKAG